MLSKQQQKNSEKAYEEAVDALAILFVALFDDREANDIDPKSPKSLPVEQN